MNFTEDRLRSEYLKRREKNTHYSLRAFARDLGLSHTHLSLAFSGKRKLSPSQIAKITFSLGLSGEEMKDWFSGAPQKAEFQDLQFEQEKIIAHWFHLAILEATYLKDAEPTAAWFAKRLGINPIEAREALDRLLELEMLEEKNGKLKKTRDHARLPTQESRPAMRAYYRAVIEKSLTALSDPSKEAYEARSISGGTVAIQKTKIHRARERLMQFQESFLAEFGAKNADEVYQLNLQFFPLTKPSLSKGKKKT